MSKKYEALAKEIVEKVGGNDNVESLHHCQTRLRFKLFDNGKADLDVVSALDGVVKALVNGGMFQVKAIRLLGRIPLGTLSARSVTCRWKVSWIRLIYWMSGWWNWLWKGCLALIISYSGNNENRERMRYIRLFYGSFHLQYFKYPVFLLLYKGL